MFERLIWLVPLAVAVGGIWRPRAGLLVLGAALPLFGTSSGGPYLAALDVSCLAAIVTGWCGRRPDGSPLVPVAAAFVVVSLLSLIPSPYEPPSWRPSVLLALLRHLPEASTWSALYSWRAAADLALGFGLFLTVRRAFAGRSPRPLALALLAGLGVTLLLGFADQAGLITLLDYRPAGLPGQAFYPRLRSLFSASTRLAEYIVVAAPLGMAALVGAKGPERRLVLPLGAVMLAGLGLTLQRGGWVAGGVQVAFLAVVVWRRWRHDAVRLRRGFLAAAATLIAALSLLVVGGGALGALTERVHSFVSGLTLRAPLWAGAWELTRERPLLGHGMGTFAPAYDGLLAAGRAAVVPFRASGHHLYLQLSAERGLLGLLALGLLGVAAVVCLRRPRAGQEAICLGIATSLLGLAVYGLVQNLFQERVNHWLVWLVLGCVTVATRRWDSAFTRRAAWGLVAAALLVVPFRLAAEQARYAGTREFGLHEVEGTPESSFRWSGAFAVQRLRRTGDTLVLTLTDGHPRAAARDLRVKVELDGREVAALQVGGEWREYRIVVGPPRREWALLTLEARPTFRPFSDFRRYPDLPESTDHRRLGVALMEPRWE